MRVDAQLPQEGELSISLKLSILVSILRHKSYILADLISIQCDSRFGPISYLGDSVFFSGIQTLGNFRNSLPS